MFAKFFIERPVLANVIALAQPQVLRFAVDDLYKGVTAAKLGRYAILLLVIAVVAGVFLHVALRMFQDRATPNNSPATSRPAPVQRAAPPKVLPEADVKHARALVE